MGQFAVIGTSAFMDVACASGPFRSYEAARLASEILDHKGWVTEIVEMEPADAIADVTNDEGAES